MLHDNIKEIEERLGQDFDLSNRRHFLLLEAKIKRAFELQARKIALIEEILSLEKTQGISLYSKATHYTVKRR